MVLRRTVMSILVVDAERDQRRAQRVLAPSAITFPRGGYRAGLAPSAITFPWGGYRAANPLTAEEPPMHILRPNVQVEAVW